MKTWLIDTGPIVAYLDKADAAHPQIVQRLDPFAGQLVTTAAVITEAMYLLGAVQLGPRRLAEFAAASGLQTYDFSTPGDLHDAASLMEQYSDTPMDYADATLVMLAEGLNVLEILTLDRRGFSTFRTRKQRAFRHALDFA